MNWSVLGIEATKDKKAITQAYRSRLGSVNPEDKPQEFMALRAAYEEALTLADQEEKPQEEKTEVELWRDQLDALYHDFPRRISVEAWQELLNDDLCMALDTRPQIEETLLVYFLENYNLPQNVWKYLDQAFRWLERKEELYEKFPKDFVDFVIVEGAMYPDVLPYDLYMPGRDAAACDKYLELYRNLRRAEPQDQEKIVSQMKDLKESHPYGQAWILCHAIAGDHPEKIRDLDLLCELYPEDANLKLVLADSYMTTQEWKKAEEICRGILEKDPEKNSAQWTLCQALAEQECYREAVDGLTILGMHASGNPGQRAQLDEVRFQWNEKLIEQLKARCEEEPENTQIRYELAFCYMQNQRGEECRELAKTLSPENMEPFGYYNLMSILDSEDKKWDAALHDIDMLCQIIPALEDDGTERTRQCMQRLPEMVHRKGEILSAMKRYDEALEVYEETLKLSPDNLDTMGTMAGLCLYRRYFDRALNICREMLRIRPDLPMPYYYTAVAHYKMNRDGEAFEAVNRAIELDRSDLGYYILKLRILIRNQVMDQAKELLQMLQANDLEDQVDVRYCDILIKDMETEDQGDRSGLLEQYRKVEEQMETEGTREWAPELYYRIAILMTEQDDVTGEALLTTIDKGLETDPEDVDCRLFKAWVLKKEDRSDEAYQIYRELEQVIPDHYTVLSNIGAYLYRDLSTNAVEALKYFEKCIRINDNGDNRFYAGMCAESIGQYQQAEEHFLREQELEPNLMEGYFRLSRLYQMMGRREDALKMAQTAVDRSAETEANKRDRTRYFLSQIEILRRFGCWEEAVKVALSLKENCDYIHGYSLAVKTCLQYGQFDRAEKLLKEWKRHMIKENQEDYYLLKIKWQIFRGKPEKASVDTILSRKNLSQEGMGEIARILAGTRGKRKANIILEHWQNCLKDEAKYHNDPSQILVNLAISYMRMGAETSAREHAAKALEILEKIQKKYTRHDPIYEGRMAMALAILGERERAAELLEHMKNSPRCEGCIYQECKDAEIWECYIEELMGDPAKALEMAKEGLKRNPDDGDFLEIKGMLENP